MRQLARWMPVGLWLGLIACASGPEPEAAAAPQAEAGLEAPDLLVSPEWLARTLDHPDVVVLHVGADRAAYDAGHVPGARFLPLSEIVSDEGGVNELPPEGALTEAFARRGVGDRSLVVLYGGRDGLFAARAFFTLDTLGQGRQAALLDGGLERWAREGHPVSREAPGEVEAGDFSPAPEPDRVVDTAWVADHLDDPDVVLVDARPPEQYAGLEAGEGVTRPGHIPGARSFFWRRALVGAGDTSLLDEATLRRKLDAADVPRDATVVAYCRTGVMASMVYFVARHLGYDVKLYDGSYLAWSADPSRPVTGP